MIKRLRRLAYMEKVLSFSVLAVGLVMGAGAGWGGDYESFYERD